MAINIPIITSLEDTGIKNAKAAFGDFKTLSVKPKVEWANLRLAPKLL
jgi:hypothetical protein